MAGLSPLWRENMNALSFDKAAVPSETFGPIELQGCLVPRDVRL